MKLSRKRLMVLILVFAVCILSMRFVWSFLKLPLALRLHAEQWKEAFLGLSGHEKLKLPSQEPEEQARFWLAEVARFKPADQNAELATGAAWMLDGPGKSFADKHVQMKGYPESPDPIFKWPQLDFDSIAVSVAGFHEQCRGLCLESIEAATRLDPDNVEWWRERALLLFDRDFSGLSIKEPRRVDWLAILKECSEHDPDNALYNYLAALQLWSHSASYRLEKEGYVLEISDPIQYEQGNLAFASGQKKARLLFGVGASTAAMRFIQKTAVNPLEWFDVADGRSNATHATGALFAIQRWQNVQQETRQRNGDIEGQIATLRAVLHLSEQWQPAGNEAGAYFPFLVLRRWSLANVQEMTKEHRDQFSEAQIKNIDRQVKEVRLESQIQSEAYKQINQAEKIAAKYDSLFTGILGGLQGMTVWFLCIAVMSWGIAGLLTLRVSMEPQGLGVLRHFMAWIAGYGISFVIFGICPAGILPATTQSLVLRGVIWTIVLGPFAAFWLLLRAWFRVPTANLLALTTIVMLPMAAFAFHESMFSALKDALIHLPLIVPVVGAGIVMLLAWMNGKLVRAFVKSSALGCEKKTALIATLALIGMVAFSILGPVAEIVDRRFPSGQLFVGRNWNEIKNLAIRPDEARGLLGMENSPWIWAVVQWFAYHGPIVAPLSAFLLLGLWSYARQCKTPRPTVTKWTWARMQFGQAGKIIGNSALSAAACCFVFYLASSPTITDAVHASHVRRIELYTNPDREWEQLNAEIAKVKSAPEVMAKLQQQVDNAAP